MEIEEKIKYHSIAEAILVLGIIVLGSIGLNPNTAYYCEERNIAVPSCDELTTYYGLPNGKCINEELGNKLCSSGWIEFSKIVESNSTEEVLIESQIKYVDKIVEVEKIVEITKFIDRIKIIDATNIEWLNPRDKVITIANGGTFVCETPEGKITSYTKCLKDDGQEGYLGELV